MDELIITQIATFTLERCADSVSKIASLTVQYSSQEMHPNTTSMAHGIPSHQATPIAANATAEAVSLDYQETTLAASVGDYDFLLSDILGPNAFNMSWEVLWNTSSAMGLPAFTL
jgi:hypothetical protein